MLEKTLILNRHGSLPQCVRHVFNLYWNPIHLAMDGLVLNPLPRLLILVVDKGALIHGVILCANLHNGHDIALHILHENSREDTGSTDSHQQNRQQDKAHAPGPALSSAAFLPRSVRLRLSSSVFHRRHLLFNFFHLSPPGLSTSGPNHLKFKVCQNTPPIVSSRVNIENVEFSRKKVPAWNGFCVLGQDNSCRKDLLFVFLTPFPLAIPSAFV